MVGKRSIDSHEEPLGLLDSIKEQLSSNDPDVVAKGCKVLHSLDLPNKAWDTLIEKHTVAAIVGHLNSSSEFIKMEVLEALVSICSTGEHPTRRLYAHQLLPSILNSIKCAQSAMLLEGCLCLVGCFVETVGEAAAAQCAPVVDLLVQKYAEASPRTKLKIAELLECLSEDQLLSSLPDVAAVDCSQSESSISQLFVCSAMVNNGLITHQQLLDILILYIDADRKISAASKPDCMRKVFELMANVFCGSENVAINRHLEVILVEEAIKRLSAPDAVTESVLNALANYYSSMTDSSSITEKDIISCLKQVLIESLKNADAVPIAASTNLLRAMSMVCDFSISPSEELTIYSVQSPDAVVNLAPLIFYLSESAEKMAYIMKWLTDTANPSIVIEYAEAALQYGEFDFACVRRCLQALFSTTKDRDLKQRAQELLQTIPE